MSPIKNNYMCGYCDVCEDGRIQFDKINNYYFCLDCNKTWEEDTWDALVEMDKKKSEFSFREYDQNLTDLNRL